MSVPALQHLGKENEGPANSIVTSTAAPAAARAAFQDKYAADNIRAEAGGIASHPKLELPLSALGLASSEGRGGVATRSRTADASNEGHWGPSKQEAPTMQASTFGLSVSQHSSGLRQTSALTEQLVSVSALEDCTAVHKAHPAGEGSIAAA